MPELSHSDIPLHTPALDVTTQQRGPTVIVTVRGEIDLSTGGGLERELHQALAATKPPNPLVADLGEVSFIGSSGLAVLVELSRLAEQRGSALRVVSARRAVCRPVEAAGLREVLRLHPTLESALAAG